MEASIGISPSGSFRIVKRSKHRGTVSEMSFDNLVLDIGWNNWKQVAFSSNAYPEYLYLGTGTTQPQKTDQGLESLSATLDGKRLASYSTAVVYSEPDVMYDRVTIRFDYGEGEAEGVWTELGTAFEDPNKGVSDPNPYTLPYNRSLFKDANGNPVSLTVLSDEYLTVYVELRLYWNLARTTGSFLFNGASVNYTAGIVALQQESLRYFGSVFAYGLPGYAGYSTDNDSVVGTHLYPSSLKAPDATSYLVTSVDEPAMTVTGSYSRDPNTGTTAFNTLGFFCRGGSNSDLSVRIYIWLDQTLSKADDERLMGSWSVQFFRDESAVH